MPRCFSISIQSETAWRAFFLPLTRAGELNALPRYEASFASVVCQSDEIIARFSISCPQIWQSDDCFYVN